MKNISAGNYHTYFYYEHVNVMECLSSNNAGMLLESHL